MYSWIINISASITLFSVFLIASDVFFIVSLEVCTAGINSTSGIKGAGLKKCIPTTLSGFLHDAAIDAIDREDVFEAIMQSLVTNFSILTKVFCLIFRFSIIASTTNSLLLISFKLFEK